MESFALPFPMNLSWRSPMDSESRFLALEIMCRQQAQTADEESKYWLAEAEEWSQLRLSSAQRQAAKCADAVVVQFTPVSD
jgi:hypothetical protein